MGMGRIFAHKGNNMGTNLSQHGSEGSSNLNGYQKNTGGSSQQMHVPSTNQSTVGTEASKKTGVRIVGKVPEANKLKVHSAKAENSTKGVSRSGGNKKAYDHYGHQESEMGDDGDYSQIDSISKMDSSMMFGGSEYMDNDHSEHGGHKPRSMIGRSHIGESKLDLLDEGVSMSSKNKYDSKNDGGYNSHLDHNDKHRPNKDSYNKQGDDDDFRGRVSHYQHPHQHGGPLIHGDSHMHNMPEPGYKQQDMSRGGDSSRNGGYQQHSQAYPGYQQTGKGPNQKNKLKQNDEAMFQDQKMPRNMYMPPANNMQDMYTSTPYNYLQQHPPNSKYAPRDMGFGIDPMHDRPEGFDPSMPNPSTIDGLFNMKPGDQRLANMPIPYSNPVPGPKKGHGESGSHHKYTPEEIPGGKYGKYPTSHFDMPPNMGPPGMPHPHAIGRVDIPNAHPGPYVPGAPSNKEGTSTSSRDGNLHKRIMELELQLKEREAVER